MPKRLARKPSTASLTPAAANSRNANSIWFDAIAHTTTGTSRMRASVIRLGILKRLAPALHGEINLARPLAKQVADNRQRAASAPLHGWPFRFRPNRMNEKRNGLTYAQAGVDIDAG